MIVLLLTASVLGAPHFADSVRRHVDVSVTSPQARTKPNRPSFQATKILEVQFHAEFRQRLSGDHLVEFKVYTPKGKLYQVLSVPFTGRGGARKARKVAGYPRALEERDMRAVASKYHVTASLPVAGTWIMTSSLYGQWRVEAHIDGQAQPSGHETFSIQP
jgi:hypothetical protein